MCYLTQLTIQFFEGHSCIISCIKLHTIIDVRERPRAVRVLIYSTRVVDYWLVSKDLLSRYASLLVVMPLYRRESVDLLQLYFAAYSAITGASSLLIAARAASIFAMVVEIIDFEVFANFDGCACTLVSRAR